MKFRNGIFIITEEVRCPLYNEGEEFSIDGVSLTFPAAKPTCLILTKDVLRIASEEVAYEKLQIGAKKKTRFQCGGCTGLVSFEFKKEKEFATIQMKLLMAAERREKIKEVAKFAAVLRTIVLFKPLSSDDLIDLASLLKLEDYDYGYPILQKGTPGTKFYVIISGKVEVIDDDGLVLNRMEEGEVFGEMSLLSGDTVTAAILAAEPCQIATLSQKNFRHILNRFPTLQIFFYKLLVSRIMEANMQRTDELSSGMSGLVSDVATVELCQMVNSVQKSGSLELENDDVEARIIFNDGEIVFAEYDEIKDEEAFYEILNMTSGRFKFIQGISPAEKKYWPIGGFMALLMEGMKRIDDARGGIQLRKTKNKLNDTPCCSFFIPLQSVGLWD